MSITMKELDSLVVKSEEELRREAEKDLKLPSMWKISTETKGYIKECMEIHTTKHGLYSAIPLMCKGNGCPYAQICPIIDRGQSAEGSRCPLEIALIMKKIEEYKNHFDVDEHDIVDMGLIKDLVDYDVQLFRAENRIAMQSDFVENVVVGVADNGTEIVNPQISKAAEYKEKIQTKKHKVLQLMHSTRQDKAGDKLTITLDPSTYAAQLMAQISGDMKPGQIFDDE